MTAPQQLWWVDFKANGSKGTGRRHYLAPKGGKFSSLVAARRRKEDILRGWPDADVRIFGSGLINWTEIS